MPSNLRAPNRQIGQLHSIIVNAVTQEVMMTHRSIENTHAMESFRNTQSVFRSYSIRGIFFAVGNYPLSFRKAFMANIENFM